MKKVLKTVGKVVGWFFAVIFGVLALLSVVTLPVVALLLAM